MDKLVREMKLRLKPVKKMLVLNETLRCPGCKSNMAGPIYLCNDGHSLCNTCISSAKLCPVCKETFTNMRNLTFEEMVVKKRVPCIHRQSGCQSQVLPWEMSAHILECAHRWLTCPLHRVHKCRWFGPLRYLLEHLSSTHPEDVQGGDDESHKLARLSVRAEIRLGMRPRARRDSASYPTLLFLVSLFVNPARRCAYWTVQYIGSPTEAKEFTYEIHVNCIRDPIRRIVFSELCACDTKSIRGLISNAHCPMMVLDKLDYFMMEKKLHFECVIRDSIKDIEIGKCDVYSSLSVSADNAKVDKPFPVSATVLVVSSRERCPSEGSSFHEDDASTYQD